MHRRQMATTPTESRRRGSIGSGPMPQMPGRTTAIGVTIRSSICSNCWSRRRPLYQSGWRRCFGMKRGVSTPTCPTAFMDLPKSCGSRGPRSTTTSRPNRRSGSGSPWRARMGNSPGIDQDRFIMFPCWRNCLSPGVSSLPISCLMPGSGSTPSGRSGMTRRTHWRGWAPPWSQRHTCGGICCFSSG